MKKPNDAGEMGQSNKGDDDAIYEIVSAAEEDSLRLLETIDREEEAFRTLYTQLSESDSRQAYESRVESTLAASKRASANIIKAYQKSLSMRDELSARWRDLSKGQNRKVIPPPPANSIIDIAEDQGNHFARGLNTYKLLLILFIGSFAGVIIEMFWCLVTRGYVESRAGLVYGPFNLLYGAGAVAMTLFLYRFRNKGRWISFLGGAVIGSALEYVCSWGQEMVFGSCSWDYSNMPFNINGRICFVYALFWGILGVLWIKSIYPRIANLILKIPNNAGKIITWVLTAFLLVNVVISAIAVFRWSQRVDMVEAGNSFWEFIDTHFPNERMERIFANMKFN